MWASEEGRRGGGQRRPFESLYFECNLSIKFTEAVVAATPSDCAESDDEDGFR